MPKLMSLHERYVEKGLVILAINGDTSLSLDELREECERLSERNWAGRTLPFRVALDGDARSDDSVGGATAVAYGIPQWPSTVVIDKNGTIVRLSGDDLEPDVARLLGNGQHNE
jgi:hypothetical protein